MSQNDFTIANQGFPAFRADLNSALQALASNSSGTSAPSTTFANMWWYDSSNNIMYIRNEDNDAWIKFAELDQANDKFVLSGTLQLDDGTVSAPALTFNSDTNMGIYRGGTDILKFVTAGTDAITIDASQGVTLAGKLDVSSGTIKLDGNYPVGSGNVALGGTALDSISGANNNVAIGNQSLTSNTSGSSLTAIGGASLYSNTTASNNVAVGFNAGYSITTGANNSVLGTYAFDANSTGDDNTAIGYFSLSANTTGANNVSIGKGALQSNTTASNNSALGFHSLFSNTTGANNTAIGYASMAINGTGASNTAVGYQAGYSNTTAVQGTFVGEEAGYSNTTGLGNTFVGSDSGYLLTTGTRNQFFGKNSGELITTGSKNTIIGGYNGNQDGLDIRSANNQVVLSDGDGNVKFYVDASGNSYFDTVNQSTDDSLYIENNGVIQIRRASGASRSLLGFRNGGASVGTITCSTTATAYNTSSDHRLKENVVDMTGAIDRVKQLSPKRFNFIADADTTVDGFLAHEAQTVVAEAVTGTHNEVDDNGDAVMQGIDQSKLVPLLTGALKEAIAKIEELEARIATLEGA